MRRFYLHKRGEFFYAVIVDPDTGRRLSARSTGTGERDEAAAVVVQWLREGIPQGRKRGTRSAEVTFSIENILDAIRKAPLEAKDAGRIVSALKERGLIVGNFAKAGPSSVPFLEWLRGIWDFDTSPFLKEKRSYRQAVTKRHSTEQASVVARYWDTPEWEGVLLAEVTRARLKEHLLHLAETKLAPATVNKALTAVSAPLAWAARNEILPVNPAEGIPRFSGQGKKRDILSEEELRALVAFPWKDVRARAAFLVAVTTGARMGEICAIQRQDIGEDRLYIRHSWNASDGLKCTKNGEEREGALLPVVRSALLDLVEGNPHGKGEEGFVFYGTKPDQPIDAKVLADGFLDALHGIGIDEGTRKARGVVFHSLRHCFATELANRIDQRQAMKATGHRTSVVFEGYADHKSEGDFEKISAAVSSAFGNIIDFQRVAGL